MFSIYLFVYSLPFHYWNVKHFSYILKAAVFSFNHFESRNKHTFPSTRELERFPETNRVLLRIVTEAIIGGVRVTDCKEARLKPPYVQRKREHHELP